MAGEPRTGPGGQSWTSYMTYLSADYGCNTGNSTYKVIAQALQDLSPANSPQALLTTDSIINDNACGPGIATAAIVAHLGTEPARIEANDRVPAMVTTTQDLVARTGWQHVNAEVVDSHALSYADDTFTLAVSNINVFTYEDPLQCLREMYRTLQPGGTALVTTWKRFTAADLIHAAQRGLQMKPRLMPVPKAEFLDEDHLAYMMRKAGFRDVKAYAMSVLCEGEEVEGLRAFIKGEFTKNMRATWTEEDIARWPDEVDIAIRAEVETTGGVEFEAWIVTGVK